jgi:hypothetical protein
MTRTTKPTTIINNQCGIRLKMFRNAMAYNKFLTKHFLQFKTNETLLNFCHPDSRIQFELELGLRTNRE